MLHVRVYLPEQAVGALSLLLICLFAGYLIAGDSIPDWWTWVSYGVLTSKAYSYRPVLFV